MSHKLPDITMQESWHGVQITGIYTFTESEKAMIVQSLRDSADMFNKVASNCDMPERLQSQFRQQQSDANQLADSIEDCECLSTHREAVVR